MFIKFSLHYIIMAEATKEAVELREELAEYAKKAGYKLNPNEKIVQGIIAGLLRNRKFNGDIYCPCRIVTKNKEEDKKIACPCIYHHGEIELQDHCKCNLFWKK